VSQPDWHSCTDWQRFGRPRVCFAISAGNMDSMINHYTANKKVRNDDAYSPGGKIGLRPDRATLSYCQRAREAYKGVPVIAGGVEASLRRLAHYDYWSDKVRRSILLDSKADLVVFGMGENAIVEIVQRLASGQTVKELRDMRGIAYALGASETPPEDALKLPSYDQVVADKLQFAEATRIIHSETNPYNARRLIQWHGTQAVVVNPPQLPISEAAMDRIYGLPYTRRPPSYTESIPAFEMIKDSVPSCVVASADARSVRSQPIKAEPFSHAAKKASSTKSSSFRRARLLKARSAISAAQPPTCIRCAVPSPKSKRSADVNLAYIPRSANCWASITSL
jgi:uncharacterized radical SAM protein YgiQ